MFLRPFEISDAACMSLTERFLFGCLLAAYKKEALLKWLFQKKGERLGPSSLPRLEQKGVSENGHVT
jgi:hypothetical protein